MTPNALDPRLCNISTPWSLVIQAHANADDPQARAALELLLNRYKPVVRQYLLGALRNSAEADDLFQEFSLRLLTGRFQGADQARGRFRDYLRTTLINLVRKHHRDRKKRSHRTLPEDLAEPTSGAPEQHLDEWNAQFRDVLLGQGWEAVQEQQKKRGTPYYTVLEVKANATEDLTAAQLADKLRGLGWPNATEVTVRQWLRRAREMFADGIYQGALDILNNLTPDQVEEELCVLGLQPYCQSAVERNR